MNKTINIIDVMMAFTGQDKYITIPKFYMCICNYSLDNAAFFTQLLTWSYLYGKQEFHHSTQEWLNVLWCSRHTFKAVRDYWVQQGVLTLRENRGEGEQNNRVHIMYYVHWDKVNEMLWWALEKEIQEKQTIPPVKIQEKTPRFVRRGLGKILPNDTSVFKENNGDFITEVRNNIQDTIKNNEKIGENFTQCRKSTFNSINTNVNLNKPLKRTFAEGDTLQPPQTRATIIRNGSHQLRQPGVPKKEQPPVTVPATVQTIIDHWNDPQLRLRKSHTGNKTHRESVSLLKKLLSGKLYKDDFYPELKGRRFSVDEIKDVIIRFSKAVNVYEYEPPTKAGKFYLKKMSIAEFIHDPFRSQQKSMFAMMIQTPGYPRRIDGETDLLQDEHPQVTKKLIRWYQVNVLSLRTEITPYIKNQFIKASKRWVQFYETNKYAMLRNMDTGMVNMCPIVGEALLNAVHGDTARISPTRFGSDYTFNHIVPQYLSAQGYFTPMEE